jgi:hypothetical protein
MKRLAILIGLASVLFCLNGCSIEKVPVEPGNNTGGDSLITGTSTFKRGCVIRKPNELTPAMKDILRPEVVRIELSWLRFEPEPGEFDSNFVFRHLNEYSEDIDIMIHVRTKRGWMTGHPEITSYTPGDFPPQDTTVFKNSMAELVRLCCGRVRYFQIFNEPDVDRIYMQDVGQWNGTPEELIMFTNMFYTVVKSECPEAQVVVCGLAGNMVDTSAAILMNCQFDYWDLHCYNRVDVQRFINRLWDYDRNKGFVVSECGVPNVRDTIYNSIEEINVAKAEMICPLLRNIAETGAEFACWNTIRYEEEGQHFGKYWGLFDGDGNPYEAAYVFGATADSAFGPIE